MDQRLTKFLEVGREGSSSPLVPHEITGLLFLGVGSRAWGRESCKHWFLGRLAKKCKPEPRSKSRGSSNCPNLLYNFVKFR